MVCVRWRVALEQMHVQRFVLRHVERIAVLRGAQTGCLQG